MLDWKTLIRGWLLCFAVSFPFMFLPTIIINGWLLNSFIQRIPQAILYAGFFTLAIIIAAVVNNYQSLAARKRIFDQPAFKQLSFYGRLNGLGSLHSHIETFLIGRVNNYFFRLNIIDPETVPVQVSIVPCIDISGDFGLMKRLIEEHDLQEDLFFGRTIELTPDELQNKTFLLDRLKKLDKLLTDYGALPTEIDEQEL